MVGEQEKAGEKGLQIPVENESNEEQEMRQPEGRLIRHLLSFQFILWDGKMCLSTTTLNGEARGKPTEGTKRFTKQTESNPSWARW